MKNNLDYIVVGCGLAGLFFCEQLRLHKKSFVVIDSQTQQSSTVAAGLYNPVVLKRFTKVWKAEDLLKLALPHYNQLEQFLDTKLNYTIPIYRRLDSIEEQNEWFIASDKPSLNPFMSSELIPNNNLYIKAPYNFGKVLNTGRIDIKALIKAYVSYLVKNACYIQEVFNYNELDVNQDFVGYRNLKAKHIVFAEGASMKANPYFYYLPLDCVKGEMLTIKAPDLKINYVLKGNVFVLPIKKDIYTVGATYNWEDKTPHPTAFGKSELVTKLKELISCDFKIISHVAGIRPTVKDRRPLIGQHHNLKNLYLLNGLGTRGVMNAPFLAQHLFQHITNNTPLIPEVNISRFMKYIC